MSELLRITVVKCTSSALSLCSYLFSHAFFVAKHCQFDRNIEHEDGEDGIVQPVC